jgi:hypothetical protein
MSPPEAQLTEQIWSSLKIIVLVFAVLSPLIIVFLALRFRRIKKKLIHEHHENQKLIEKRIEIYERIGPKLNDIFSFFSYTGNWKELSPPDIMKLKRELDKEITINTPLFSNDLIRKYNSFILLCFVSHSGWEHKEKIKSMYELRQEHIADWKADWIPFFDTNNVVEGIKLKERYDGLMEYFKKEINPTPF